MRVYRRCCCRRRGRRHSIGKFLVCVYLLYSYWCDSYKNRHFRNFIFGRSWLSRLRTIYKYICIFSVCILMLFILLFWLFLFILYKYIVHIYIWLDIVGFYLFVLFVSICCFHLVGREHNWMTIYVIWRNYSTLDCDHTHTHHFASIQFNYKEVYLRFPFVIAYSSALVQPILWMGIEYKPTENGSHTICNYN